MLGVIQHGHLEADTTQRFDESGKRTITCAADLGLHPVDLDGRGDSGRAAVFLGGVDPLLDALQRQDGSEILLGERVPHFLRRDLTALTLGDLLDYLGKLDLQPSRQCQPVVGLHDVGHPAFAGLRVDSDHGLVGAPDVLGVDRQIRHLPQHVVDVLVGLIGSHLHRVQPLVDGVLVTTGERGVDQVAAVGVTLGHRQLVAVLHCAPDLVDVGEVDLWVHAPGEQVQSQRHQTHVAGALPVAEQAAFDPVGAGLIAQFCCGDGGSAVVVRMQTQDDRSPVGQVAAHPLDGVGVDVRGSHLHGSGQVEDDRVVRRRLDDLADGVAHLFGVFQFGARVGLRRVLEAPLGTRVLGGLLNALASAVGRDGLHRGPVGAKDYAALQD